MIRTRIITGLIIALVIIGSILLLPFHALTLLISFIVSLSTWEFIRLRFSSEIAVLIALILFFSFIYLSFGITFKFILISSLASPLEKINEELSKKEFSCIST